MEVVGHMGTRQLAKPADTGGHQQARLDTICAGQLGYSAVTVLVRRLRGPGFQAGGAGSNPVGSTTFPQVKQSSSVTAQVCKTITPELRNAGLPLLHNEPLPFPLGNWRAQFVAGMREALSSA